MLNQHYYFFQYYSIGKNTKTQIFDISVGPLDVELIGRKDPVSVGRLYEFRCQSVGARPPPHITWWRGSIQLRENVTSKVSTKLTKAKF